MPAAYVPGVDEAASVRQIFEGVDWPGNMWMGTSVEKHADPRG